MPRMLSRVALIAAALVVIGALLVRGAQSGVAPAAVAASVDPAPPGCETFDQHAARELLGSRAIEIHGKGEMPEAECTWHVPGTSTGAVLYVQTPESLRTDFPGLTLDQVLQTTRPQPSPPGQLVEDLHFDGRSGWATVMIASPSEAVTRSTWVANGKLYSLAMTRTTNGNLERELSDVSVAVIAVDRRVTP